MRSSRVAGAALVHDKSFAEDATSFDVSRISVDFVPVRDELAVEERLPIDRVQPVRLWRNQEKECELLEMISLPEEIFGSDLTRDTSQSLDNINIHMSRFFKASTANERASELNWSSSCFPLAVLSLFKRNLKKMSYYE